MGVHQHINFVSKQLQLPSCFVTLFESNSESVSLYIVALSWKWCKHPDICKHLLWITAITWVRSCKGCSYYKAFPKVRLQLLSCQHNLGKLLDVESEIWGWVKSKEHSIFLSQRSLTQIQWSVRKVWLMLFAVVGRMCLRSTDWAHNWNALFKHAFDWLKLFSWVSQSKFESVALHPIFLYRSAFGCLIQAPWLPLVAPG